ncbi:MAG: PQQ-binding-like beta-propeller repeat protein, partial [Acidobacteriota bacterium]
MTRLPIRCIPFDLRSALAAAVLCTTAYASGACLADDSTPPASTDAASAAVAWPQFRGAEAKGLSSAPAPTSWDLETGKNVLWRIDVPGLGHSAPIVWGDRVFLTTAVREQGDQSLKPGLYGDIDPVTDEGVHRWLVIAYDRASGEELWRREAHRGVPAIQRHTKATHANSTPATDGQRVVAFLGSEGLHAYDLDGEELWSVDFGVLDSGYFAAPEAQWGFGSSPVLHDGKVIIQVDVQENSFLAALDADTGEVIWRTPRRDVPTWSSPTVIDDGDGGLQVVINGYKRLGGYSFATGEPLWWMPGGGDIPVPTPFEHQGRIVFSSSHGLSSPIFVVDQAARGDVSLSGGASSNEAIPWAHFRGGAYMPTPIA